MSRRDLIDPDSRGPLDALLEVLPGGLPPTFIDVGTVDLFRDEDIEFAMRLMQADVPTELHVHPGAYHDSEGLAPEAPLSRRIWERRIDALRRALAPA